MKHLYVLSLIVLSVFSFVIVDSAEAVYPLMQQDPSTAGFNLGGSANATRGWRFRVNDSNLCVTQLGVNSRISDSVSHTVTLFDVSTQAVLAQVTTTPGPGWVFEDIASQIPLTQGNEYIIAAHSVPDDWYYFGGTGQVATSWFPTGTIQYLDMRYANSVGPSDFPTDVVSDMQYGIPDFNYEICDAEPASIPTMNEWGIIVFVGILFCYSVYFLRTKKIQPI